MKIVGMCLVRNEAWVLRLTIDAAMRWVDDLVFTLHNCTDDTEKIVYEAWDRYRHARPGQLSGPSRIHINEVVNEEHWSEMELRQSLFEKARFHNSYDKGEHYAMIDADEVVTANQIPRMRGYFEALAPGQLLDLPMIPAWRGLEKYRDDGSVWSRSILTVGFRDGPTIEGWAPRGAFKYEYHNRPPKGHLPNRSRPVVKGNGGALHLQWIAWQRVLWKHRLYVCQEILRWPGRRTITQLLRIYSEALDEVNIRTKSIPHEWLESLPVGAVDLAHEPWHKAECERLIEKHGRGILCGMDLWGWPGGS